MKKSFLSFAFLFGVACFVLSCKKSPEAPGYELKTIDKTLKVNEAYQFNLGPFGDEEGAAISNQAAHFLISRIDTDINTSWETYTYVPAANFTGTDQVIIKSCRGWNGGANSCPVAVFTVIKFTITN